MTSLDFQLRGVDDPRLAVHATGALPVWLWSVDGTRVLWANPVGARLLGAEHGKALGARIFGPADPHRRLVMQLAGKLPPNGATRLERLRGFGARLGGLVTCGCARLTFADGSSGVLIAAVEPVGQPMPLVERLRGLVEGSDTPIAAFGRDGLFIGSSAAARTLLGFRNLTEAGLDQARAEALQNGRAETPIGIGRMVLQRVGSGGDIGLVALLEPGEPVATDRTPEVPISQPAAVASDIPIDGPSETVPPESDVPDDEAIDTISEAPAEFTRLGETLAEAQTDIPPTQDNATADEPSPLVVPVADESPAEADASTHESAATPESLPEDSVAPQPHDAEATDQPAPADAPSQQQSEDEEPATILAVELEPRVAATSVAPSPPRQHPLRFVWQLDGDSRFSVKSDELICLIGPRTAAQFGRSWAEIRAALALDPDDRFAQAIATRHTWSGITLHWPADGSGDRLPLEMSGLPVQDRDGHFTGYRGFGVCRDLDGLDRLAMLRRHDGADEPPPRSLSADFTPRDATPAADAEHAPMTDTSDHQASDIIVDTPRNVLPFRPVQDARSPALTPVENSAFNELARQLAERLESDAAGAAERLFAQAANDQAPDAPADATPAEDTATAEAVASNDEPAAPSEPAAPKADWLAPLATPAKGDSTRDRVLLDLMPVGVLIYRLDRLLYANAAFLQLMGHASLSALEEEGGLDALYVEEGVGGSSGTSEAGTPITVATPYSAPTAARLHTIEWDGDQALALIFDGTAERPADVVAAASIAPEPNAPSDVGHANAEELGAILDTTAEGILMFDAGGRISACNRSAEALFGYDGDELVQRSIAELFAPESNDAVRAYFDSVKSGSAESLLDHGLEALGRVREGGLFPLTMTIGRTQPDGPNYFAVFRDLSQARRIEVELDQVRKLADRAAGAKADVLARLSHEIRMPLNAIIGFAEVMIEERFGALGNERYADYLKDIRASGERVIGIVGDLLDLSRIETGKLDLAFTSQNLNELVEQCVAVMQPRANRERIIIRSSLAHALPSVTADAQALRQIVLNLIGTSIHLANAGGQVIVSTALSDFGEVVLRVRDTGHRLNDSEIAAALQPFSTPAPSERSEASGVSLSLTKALVEANRAQFHIKSAPQSGTLIEVVFSHATAAA
ncbi:PAS/PAC sensor signal transduction histidine kinase [Rhodopseudomonas palustris HaA2]|uniref:histidine kinase n=1 Tax=Rhodopseudomonas palustris (strain HaA2) TaxID=316058 RepID=Q2J031_RHOP2|nr:PAS domain-containing protein [Rhodopseudomonas palustris]ABD06179.1 PAS/PAC sensor signal transduction histidine kinase [Rhodopseudomonas palustris HaA2]